MNDREKDEPLGEFAEQLLVDWPKALGHFWHVVPKEMLGRLPHPLEAESLELAAGED